MTRLTRYFFIALFGAALLGAGLFWPATQRVAAQTIPPNQIVQCPSGTAIPQPIPTSGSNILKVINCFNVTGPGTANITLPQVLSNPATGVTATDITTIQANPGVMEVWLATDTAWLGKLGSTYNAATQTYSVTVGAGVSRLFFLYPFAPGTTTPTTGTTTGATATPASTGLSAVKCANGTTLSSPYPQNAAGEFLRVACYTITGPGTATISLTQVLADAASNVTANDKTTIQSNPGAMQVWRMGSWFLVNSSFNAGTQTYSFEVTSGAQIYVFFYPPITRRIGAQGYSFAASAGTTTGNAEELVQRIVRDDPPRATLAASGLLLMAFGLFPVLRRKQA